jgi:hypothetical protein
MKTDAEIRAIADTLRAKHGADIPESTEALVYWYIRRELADADPAEIGRTVDLARRTVAAIRAGWQN